MESKVFGEFIKSLRKNKKLTVRQLDLYSGVSHSYISQMERGARGIPSPDILKKLAKPLGVTYEELMAKAGYFDNGDNDFDELLHKVFTFFIDGIKYDDLINQLTENLKSEGYDIKFINDSKQQEIEELFNYLTFSEKIKLLHVFVDTLTNYDIEIKNEKDTTIKINDMYNKLPTKKREIVDNMIDMLYSDN